MGYYERHLTENVTKPAAYMLKSYNFTNFRVWDDITKLDVIQNNTIMLSKKLNDLDEFPLNTLLDHLDNLRFIEEMTSPKHFPIWGYLIIIIRTGIAILILVCCIWKYKHLLLGKLLGWNRKVKKKARTREQIAQLPDNKHCMKKGETKGVMIMSTLLEEEARGGINDDLHCSKLSRSQAHPLLDSQAIVVKA